MFYSLVPYLLDIHINVSLLQINDILQPVFIVHTAALLHPQPHLR